MQLIAPFLALSALVWGAGVWTWIKARSVAVKFWSVAAPTIATVVLLADLVGALQSAQSVL